MRASDDRVFEEVAVPHLDTVYRVALRLVRNSHEAEDLVQDTYLKAFKAFSGYEQREYGIRPWLLRILHNTFLNRIKRENRAPKGIEQQVLEQVYDESGASLGTVGPPELDYERLDSEVKQALDGLAPGFRAVLTLWATMEFSYQEIADILEVPLGTVMSRLHRGRQNLIRELDQYARENRLGSGYVAGERG